MAPPPELELVRLLRQAISAWKGDARELRHSERVCLDRWRPDFEKLARIDGADYERQARVLRWLAEGRDRDAVFWRPNIRSGAKFREKWDRLEDCAGRGQPELDAPEDAVPIGSVTRLTDGVYREWTDGSFRCEEHEPESPGALPIFARGPRGVRLCSASEVAHV